MPETRFLVIGARPAARVRCLAGADASVSVLGLVDDMRPHLRSATVGRGPHARGGGQLFKILEAMASGTPVVARRSRPRRSSRGRRACSSPRRPRSSRRRSSRSSGTPAGPGGCGTFPALRREPPHVGAVHRAPRGAAPGGPVPPLSRMDADRLSVVVPTRDTRELTLRCLATLDDAIRRRRGRRRGRRRRRHGRSRP
jgi:hypothetical protein